MCPVLIRRRGVPPSQWPSREVSLDDAATLLDVGRTVVGSGRTFPSSPRVVEVVYGPDSGCERFPNVVLDRGLLHRECSFARRFLMVPTLFPPSYWVLVLFFLSCLCLGLSCRRYRSRLFL